MAKEVSVMKREITGKIYPISNIEEYKRSLGTVMLDILEKQLGEKGLALAMELLKKELKEGE